MKQLFIIFIVILLPSCGGSSSDDSVYVYDTNLLLGCGFTGNETLAESALVLAQSGVDVLSSSCGMIIGVAWNESCGSPTGEVNLHLIRRESLVDAVPLGYENTESLSTFTTDQGAVDVGEINFEVIDC